MKKTFFIIALLLIVSTMAQAQKDSLTQEVRQLDAASVVAVSPKARLLQAQTGLQTIDAATIKTAPAFMGEKDIIKVIQMTSGVQAPSEGSSGFSVRGGLVDQNLILLDSAPLYNAGHFLGFISMFNNDILDGIDLYKGDFPSRYGGRLSSVLDVTTRDGDMESLQGNASVGLIASKIFIEGPLVKDRLSFSASARRSFLDLAFPFVKQVPERSKLSFFDINARLSLVASDKDRLYLSTFSGGDEFGSSLKQYGLNLMDFRYRNRTASLGWKHVFSPALLSQLTLYYSKFGFGIDCDYNYAVFDYSAFIRETGLKASLIWMIDERNTLETGVQLPYIRVNSGDCVPKGNNITINEVHIAPNFAIQPSVFVENRTKLSWANFRIGFRLSQYTSIGGTDQYYFDPHTHEMTDMRYFGTWEPIVSYWGLEPRLSISIPLNEASSVKASYSNEHQYIQQAIVSTSGSPLDVWIPASPNTKPQISDQFTLGFNRNLYNEKVETSVELFYKNNKNTSDFVENTGVIVDQPHKEAFLRYGRSYSYGAEAMVKYNFGKINGWLGYTYSKAMYDIPEINGGKPYASPVNHEHSVDILLSWNPTPRLSASAYWVFYSGAPTTLPIGRFAIGSAYAPIFASRNSSRLPDYHRLDLSLTVKSRKRLENLRWSGEWSFSIYNAYSRHNLWSVAYSYSQFEDKPHAVKLYLFPILPSLSYNIQF